MISKAALAFLDRVSSDLYGPPLPLEIEAFRRDVQAAYETAFMPDLTRKQRPALRLVTGD
jgi:hypothetical protein